MLNRRALLSGSVAMALAALPLQAAASPVLAAARQAAARRAAQSSAAAAGVKAPLATAAVTKPHDVLISRSRHPQAAAHIEYAQRQGQPTILHIDRSRAVERRAASTGSVDRHRKPAPHYERDEYPPAYVREGGINANVRYIDRHSNRGAGGAMSAQTRQLPDGARIRILVVD